MTGVQTCALPIWLDGAITAPIAAPRAIPAAAPMKKDPLLWHPQELPCIIIVSPSFDSKELTVSSVYDRLPRKFEKLVAKSCPFRYNLKSEKCAPAH